jgi:hypothetical protein
LGGALASPATFSFDDLRPSQHTCCPQAVVHAPSQRLPWKQKGDSALVAARFLLISSEKAVKQSIEGM